jgi:hypothetical protein
VIHRAFLRAFSSMTPAASRGGASGEWLMSVNLFSAPAAYLHIQNNARKHISGVGWAAFFRPVEGRWSSCGQAAIAWETETESITSNPAIGRAR